MYELSLYLIEDSEGKGGYDSYDSAVVAAYSAKEAQEIVPDNERRDMVWVPVKKVKVTYLGPLLCANYKAGDTIVSSFNAG